MQRNANVGSKLLALIAVPAIVLVAVASLGASQRLDDAAQAQSTEDGSRLAAASADFTHQLQLERLLTMRLVSGDDAVTDALAAQRDATDEAASPFTTPIDAEGNVAQRYEAAAGQIQTITDLRVSIDEGNAAPDVTLAAYTEAIASLIELDASLASRGGLPELSVALSDSLTLAKAKEARADLAAHVAAIAVVGEFRAGDYEDLAALQDVEDSQVARLEESQNGDFTTSLRNNMANQDVRAFDALVASVMDEGVIGGSGDPGVAPQAWQNSANGWLDVVRSTEQSNLQKTIAAADSSAFDASKSARLYLIGTAAAVILSLLLASHLARRINRRLQRLTTAANRLATEDLPRLVEDLRSPGDATTEPEPIVPLEVDSNDEIGQLAEAFNVIQQVTSQVAEEQAALLRRGIADIFVNLARRNQSLLDRQIEFIDGLEAEEQDPDQLENLFKLDHLATRMRRNAESLLVLAGAEPPRRRARPVELSDVVRVAIGEVEDFTRIDLLSLDDATVGGNAAVDLAHLLSELMENATQFSPPDSMVEIVGSRSAEGDYVVTIADRGIGMSVEQLQEANALLSAPPPVGLALSRSLGFIVVGRLARRLRVSVRLNTSPAGGITAVVELPADVLAGQLDAATGLPLAPAADGMPVPAGLEIDEPPTAPPTVEEPRPLVVEGALLGPPSGNGAPASLSDALPSGEDFERGLAALVGPDDGPGPDADDADIHRSFWGSLADSPEAPAAPAPEPTVDADPEPAPLSFAPPPPPPPMDPPYDNGGEPGAPAWEPAPAWLDGDLASVDAPAPVEPAFAPPPPPVTEAPVAPPPPVPEPAAATDGPPPLARREPRATLGPEAQKPRVSSTRRSPEEVRAMLSRYRRGLDDGRTAAPTTED